METLIIPVILPTIVVLLFGIVAVMLLGVVGGPIKSETPIVMTVFHLLAFLLWASDWLREALVAYVALLASCVVAQAVVAFYLFKPDKNKVPNWLGRGWLVAAYVGLIVLVLTRRS